VAATVPLLNIGTSFSSAPTVATAYERMMVPSQRGDAAPRGRRDHAAITEGNDGERMFCKDREPVPHRARWRLVPLAIVVVTALALLPDLGGQHVWSKDEARDGLVARDMVERGHWLIPRMGGRVYPYKPPLFHWLVALLSRRGVTEWSLRLPSVLAAAATVALTYSMGARLATPATGLVAAAVLASSGTFVEWARTGRLEMLLTLWLVLGFWSALRWIDERRRCHAIVLGIALGLGCLTKGPIGLLPLAALFVALGLRGAWSRRAVGDLGRALALGLALPAAWLATAAGAEGGVAEYGKDVITMFGDEFRNRRHGHGFFVVEAIGMGFLPWTLLLPGVLLILGRRWRTSWRVLLLPLLWVALVLAIFTVVVSARAVYFLPIYPSLAIIVAWTWSSSSVQERRWMLYPMVLMVATAMVAAFALTAWPLTIESARQSIVLSRHVALMVAVMASATALGVAVLLKRRRTDTLPVVVGLGTLSIFVLLHVTVQTPRLNRAYPTREVAARFAAMLPPGAEIVYVDRKLSTALMFYLEHRRIELARIRAIAGVADHPRRYGLMLEEELALLVRKQCSPPPPLREETLLGSRYVLLNLDGFVPRCSWAQST
jgi:4-amino-4-deoxy-L-arabinose transferase-like glycosyltransferase